LLEKFTLKGKWNDCTTAIVEKAIIIYTGNGGNKKNHLTQAKTNLMKCSTSNISKESTVKKEGNSLLNSDEIYFYCTSAVGHLVL